MLFQAIRSSLRTVPIPSRRHALALWLELLQTCAGVLLTDQLTIQLGQEELEGRLDRRLAQVAVARLVIPGADGDMGMHVGLAVHQRPVADQADALRLLVHVTVIVLLALDVEVLELDLAEAANR